MSAQPESGGDRYYAAVRLAELRKEIPKLITGMVVQRAKVEKHKDSDRETARDAYAELGRLRKKLVAALAEARLFLMEAEEYEAYIETL